jgi:RNA polymerase sigma-70 factor, ECF subfamily
VTPRRAREPPFTRQLRSFRREFDYIHRLDQEDLAAAPDERVAAKGAHELVLRALAGLPERQRSVLVFHDLDGVEVQELAGLLALPLSTVYTRIRRARRAFADEVTRLE